MIVVTGEFRLPVDSRAEAIAAMARVVAATRGEVGCLEYAYAEDVLEPGLFRVVERWDSRETLARHFEAPHMKQWQAERAEIGMTGRRVTAFIVASEEAL